MTSTPPRVTKKVPTKAEAARKRVKRKPTPTIASEAPSVDSNGLDSTGVRVITEMDPDYQPVRHRAGRPDVVSPELNAVLKDMLSNDQESVQIVAGEPFTIYQVRNWADKTNKSGTLPDWVQRVRVAYRQDSQRITIILARKLEGVS